MCKTAQLSKLSFSTLSYLVCTFYLLSLNFVWSSHLFHLPLPSFSWPIFCVVSLNFCSYNFLAWFISDSLIKQPTHLKCLSFIFTTISFYLPLLCENFIPNLNFLWFIPFLFNRNLIFYLVSILYLWASKLKFPYITVMIAFTTFFCDSAFISFKLSYCPKRCFLIILFFTNFYLFCHLLFTCLMLPLIINYTKWINHSLISELMLITCSIFRTFTVILCTFIFMLWSFYLILHTYKVPTPYYRFFSESSIIVTISANFVISIFSFSSNLNTGLWFASTSIQTLKISFESLQY